MLTADERKHVEEFVEWVQTCRDSDLRRQRRNGPDWFSFRPPLTDRAIIDAFDAGRFKVCFTAAEEAVLREMFRS